MKKGNTLQSKICEEIVRFQKMLEELHLLKTVSKDLRNYKRMIQVRKFD